ncbi:MAG: hypothetical protein HPY54_08615 [Chthonomonadetes bacterium]|nr:hypothetical protein [Chthonomonadetes bacterium]
MTSLSVFTAALASATLFLANTASAYASQWHLSVNTLLAGGFAYQPPGSISPIEDGTAAGSGSGHPWQAQVAGINVLS